MTAAEAMRVGFECVLLRPEIPKRPGVVVSLMTAEMRSALSSATVADLPPFHPGFIPPVDHTRERLMREFDRRLGL